MSTRKEPVYPLESLAHISADGLAHGLRDHLIAVADAAKVLAVPLSCEPWAYLAGLWHDLGKYRPGFQQYIRHANGLEAHIEGKLPSGSDKTHSAAGALHSLRTLDARFGPNGVVLARVLAYVIAGHHAGLGDWVAGLDRRLLGTGSADSEREYAEALAICRLQDTGLLELPDDFRLESALAAIPGPKSDQPLTSSLWIRMLFSTLVDADFLDTERFLNEGKAHARTGFQPLGAYVDQLTAHLEKIAVQTAQAGRSSEAVMQARSSVLTQCLEKAHLPPGVFALTVPTGGGKTLSSLAFALHHAQTHGKRRVIYAIPYTSIIEQTADVFGRVFGADQVVEHHSQADTDDRNETLRSRLSCENWDAPLVVTTNVQLFESLFAARTSRCRKLHNIANSVIVLDEAQLLPPEFLQPILDALNVLVTYYGVTLLLCTATQPTLGDSRRFDPRQNLRGLPPATPIVDDETKLFSELERVAIEWPSDLHTPLPTESLVSRLADHDCVLAIVNTRRDAAEMMRALDAATGDTTLHLSAAMCGQHRAGVIDEIRVRLQARREGSDTRPLRVVSTQLVEAGVDIDFPVVFRALAGLDSVAQAAGRCNREGSLPGGAKGQVVVFVRDIPKVLHQVRTAAQATRTVLQAGGHALTPDAFERYFEIYYAGFASRDKHGIVDHLRKNSRFEFEFRTAADKFRLVDDEDQATVIVPYASAGKSDIQPLIQKLRSGATDRWLLRQLQRYTVTARRKQVDPWQTRGDVQELVPGIYLLIDGLRYNARLGLLPEDQALDAASLLQ
ncbi:MAG: CRISPR-associated helicase Cas3' [Burkholderiales bacterium]